MGCQFSANRRAPHQVSPPSNSSTALPSSPFPRRTETLIQIYHHSESSGSTENSRRAPMNEPNHSRHVDAMMRIDDVLPDDVLLEIFYFYVDVSLPIWKQGVEAWQTLVHVCRRWRSVVLGSPHGLNLRLYCTPKAPIRDTLDVWPALPLIVGGDMSSSGTDNIIAALGQSNRVCQVSLWSFASWQLKLVLAATEVPFPELTDLYLSSKDQTLTVIPDSFLDGSAPRLRTFYLDGIPFPGLPNLLLSATHLVRLCLRNIPHSGYISPEAIVALISVLSSLEQLTLEFESPRSFPDRETRRPPPSTRVISSLHYFHFEGVTEYLEDLVTGIDTPQLDDIGIRFFNQIDFDTPRLAQFINRTPKLAKRHATVLFDDLFARVHLTPGTLRIEILCSRPDWQLPSIEQVCDSALRPLSTIEDLCIYHQYRRLDWESDAIENTLWLQLLLPFTAVKNLFLSKESAPGIAAALHELIGSRMTEVWPNLENIFVEDFEPSGPFQEDIGLFVAALQLLDRPIAISVWDNDFNRPT